MLVTDPQGENSGQPSVDSHQQTAVIRQPAAQAPMPGLRNRMFPSIRKGVQRLAAGHQQS